jgi:enamine deaminase RidA (YjgF/YER057c/UK114 family)
VTQGRQVLFISGQLADSPSGELVGGDDAGAQAEQCFRNVDALLTAAGATKSDVVKLTIYLTDLADRDAVASARTAYFGEHMPASTGLQITALVIPGARVEVEAIAVF